MKHVKLFEEFTPNTVTCDRCAWEWKLEDGGNAVFVCHECGHDNSPKFMNESEEKAKGDRGPIDNDAIETGLKNKAKESGVPLALLRLVMRRGMDAWNSGHHPGATQEQWGYARVNAFLEKGEGTWQNADKDIAKEVRDGGHDGKLPYKDKE
jgi:hypothetical protein